MRSKLWLVAVLLIAVCVCYEALEVEKEDAPIEDVANSEDTDDHPDEIEDDEDDPDENETDDDDTDEEDIPEDELDEMVTDSEDPSPWLWSRRTPSRPRPRPNPTPRRSWSWGRRRRTTSRPRPPVRPNPPVPSRRPVPPQRSCALRTFRGNNFETSARVEIGFYDDIIRINGYAGSCSVTVYVTSSFRTRVIQATRSNHLVGHAIDMNLRDQRRFCNSRCLRNPPSSYQGVRCFISRIRNDPSLRWGGDFNDPVHIDDGLNLRNPAEWARLRRCFQNAG